MRLTKYGHSCVRIEHDGGVLVIDPGSSASGRAGRRRRRLITHEHPDHLDVDADGALGSADRGAVHAHPDVAAKLDDAAT